MLGQNAIAFPVMLLFQALIFHIIMTAASPSRNKWSKSELEEIEQQWNGVHEDDDDISLDDQIYVESERRHKDATDKLQSFIDKGRYSPGDDEFEKLTREVEHAGKAAMLFAKLRMEDKLENDNGDEKKDINDEGKGGKLSWDALAKICSEWQHELSFKMVDISCYPMEPDTVLVTVQRGWDGDDVYDYLSKQNKIEELSWNEKKTWPSKRDIYYY